MGIILNRRRVYGGKSLPYDAEIEYLESTGTQWIDTGVEGGNASSVEIKISNQTTSTVACFGSRVLSGKSTSRAFCMYLLEPTGLTYFGYGTEIYSSGGFITGGVMKLNKNVAMVNGKTVKTFSVSSFNSPSTFLMFASYTNNGTYIDNRMFAGKFYYCKIFNNDILVRDYIPVRIGQVGYMYDKVSKQLFGNQGTGNFILGPDV